MEINKSGGKFAKSLWMSIEEEYSKIEQHPFVVKLADGSLSKSSFAQYLSQDILYLKDDNLALKLLSMRSENKDEKSFFYKMAEEGIAIEQAMQNDFIKYFNINEATEKSKVINAYTNFLLKNVKESSYEVAAAALLPCFWVYSEIGKVIKTSSLPGNPYQKWIDTYGDIEFEKYVSQFIEIVDKLSLECNIKQKLAMHEVFYQSTVYELAFFEESFLKD